MAEETYQKPVHGWTCFHCGENFTTIGSARDHFGAKPHTIPGCVIRVQLGDERGLQMALRKAEAEIKQQRERVGKLRAKISELNAQWDEGLESALKELEATDDLSNHHNGK